MGDTLINLTDSTKEKVILKGDTIIEHINEIDTLFNISAGDVLKKFKGYYFLNTPSLGNSWYVQALSLKKGVLAISAISADDGIQKLQEITTTASDTLSFNVLNVRITRKQFKTFVNRNGFDDYETFRRIK